MTTIQFTHDYVLVNCGPKDSGGCGIDFAMSRRFYDETKRSGGTWYCPRGHRRTWTGDTVEQRLKAEQAKTTHLADQLQASAEEAERLRQAILRDRHRFANGVCPCCNRSFENVARHVKGQHPDYDITQIKGTAEFTCSCGRSFESLSGLRIHQGHRRGPEWFKPKAPAWRAHRTVIDA